MEWSENAGNQIKVYKIRYSFFPETEYLFYEIRNTKPRYQGLMSRFSRKDLNQQYYLNGMWRCRLPVMIVNFLSSNEKVAL